MKTPIADLKLLQRWTWYRPGSEHKVPGLPADNPSRWLTHHRASTAHANRNVGFCFDGTDQMVGIDLDNCIKDGFISPVASHILKLLGGSYAEVSISGNGIKCWVYGRKFNMLCNYNIEGQKVEMYSTGKWFMFTGKRLASSEEYVCSGQPAIDWIEAHAPKRPVYTAKRHVDSTTQWIELCTRHPPAVQGKNGHGTTFSLAAKLMRAGASEIEIFQLLKTYFNPACEPPWSDRELAHKAESAFKHARP